MTKKKIDVMITAFRDGLQSVHGARVLSTDIMPAVAAAAAAGFDHFEAGGGARFQSLCFYLRENPFDMKDAFRLEAGAQAKLQTLARGINVVGLESQPRDVIQLHAELFAKHGISAVRNFDALNDVDNLVYSGQAIADAGLEHEIAVTMMELPPDCQGAHTPEFYMQVVRRILDSGVPFDSICFKDASGTSVPGKVHQTLRQARQLLPDGTRIVFHTHDTAGLGIACYLAAIEAGVDQIDLSLAPVSHGTAQPDVLTMWHALRGSEYSLDIDYRQVLEAEQVFKQALADYFVPPEALAVEPQIPLSPMPGGALTANTQMMRDADILDKYPAVIAAMGEVVRRGGYGTSVTPVSQFYFQQAFNNVMLGPWERIAEGYGKMVLGYYGKTPVEPDAEVVRAATEQLGLEPLRESPLDHNDADPNKGLEAARRRLDEAGLLKTKENLFIAATCGEKGIAFLKGEGQLALRKKEPAAEPQAPAAPAAGAGDSGSAPERPVVVQMPSADCLPCIDPAAVEGEPVRAEMPGRVVHIPVRVGQNVAAGELLVVQEHLLTRFETRAPRAGTVAAILVQVDDHVDFEQELAKIA